MLWINFVIKVMLISLALFCQVSCLLTELFPVLGRNSFRLVRLFFMKLPSLKWSKFLLLI